MKPIRTSLVVALSVIFGVGLVVAAEEAPASGELLAQIERAEDWDAAGAALQRAVQAVRRDTTHDAENVRLLEDLGRKARELGEPRWAVELYARAFDVRVSGGEAKLGAARTLADRIGKLLEKIGELEQAERWTRTRLELTPGGEIDSATANAYRRLARLIAEARPDDPEAHDAFMTGLTTPEGSGRARMLAEFYASRGDHTAAVEQQQQRLLAMGDDESWDARRDLAQAYRAAGQPELAAGEYARALDLARARFGERDVQLIQLFREVGEFYLERQRHAEAESVLMAAYELARTFYGNCPTCSGGVLAALETLTTATGHPLDICNSSRPAPGSEIEQQIAGMDQEAMALTTRGENAQARELALTALELRQATYGADSVQYADGLYYLARVSPYLEQVDSRVRLHAERVRILEAAYPGEDLRIAVDLGFLAQQAEDAEEFETAEGYRLRRAYALEASGRNLALARAYGDLAETAEARGDLRQAAEYRGQTVDLWEMMAEKDSDGYARSVGRLAESYRKLELPDEAERLLLDLARVYDENPALHRGRLNQTLRQHYTETGQEGKAAALEGGAARSRR